jgi:hypothetical protein
VLNDAIDFFSDSVQKMVHVYHDNAEKSNLIRSLEEIKQQQTMKIFDFQKKLTETSTTLLQLRQHDYDNAKLIKALRKQLEHKKAECESLNYMLKHNQGGLSLNEVRKSTEIEAVPKFELTVKSPESMKNNAKLPDAPPVALPEVENLMSEVQRL